MLRRPLLKLQQHQNKLRKALPRLQGQIHKRKRHQLKQA